MKTKKTKKSKKSKKSVAFARRGKRAVEPASNPLVPAPPASAPEPVAVPVETAAPAPKPARARISRRALTPAQRRGVELVRFLRRHTKKPYGTRGENAIVRLAREVGHLARIELDAHAAG